MKRNTFQAGLIAAAMLVCAGSAQAQKAGDWVLGAGALEPAARQNDAAALCQPR